MKDEDECRNQTQTADHPITGHDIDFVMRIFARSEAEHLVRNRMAVRDLKDRSKHYKNVSTVFDIEGNVEKSLELIECLSQATRALHPPCHEFLVLAKAVSSENAHPEHILERAILFEEYALQLLFSCNAKSHSGLRYTSPSPWLVLSGSEGTLPFHSDGALSQRDRWTARQVHRLLSMASYHEPQGGAPHRNRSQRRSLQVGDALYPPRKRRRHTTAFSDVYLAASEVKDGDNCGSYSSDYYTVSSDEELRRTTNLEEGKGEDPSCGL